MPVCKMLGSGAHEVVEEVITHGTLFRSPHDLLVCKRAETSCFLGYERNISEGTHNPRYEAC